MDAKASEMLRFQINRSIVMLYKRMLGIVEDVRADHDVMLDKIELNIPKEYNGMIANVDYFTDEKYAYIRKKILDQGNEIIRELDKTVDKFDINLK